MALRLTERDHLSVLTADAVARYMPGMRSDPFAFRRMLNRYLLRVEDPRAHADYVKFAAAKRREDAEKAETERKATARRKASYRRHTKPQPVTFAQEAAL